MENNQLIQHNGGLIQRVSNALSVTNKLLALTEPQLIPYRKKDKWGFCTPDKKIVIDCVWDEVNFFKEGLSKVKLNDKWGFINKQSVEVIPLQYDDLSYFSEGLCKFNLNGKWGFINKQGEIVIQPIYDIADNFSFGNAIVKERNDQNQSVRINKNGNIASWEEVGEEFRLRKEYSNSLKRENDLRESNDEFENDFDDNIDIKWGFVNSKNEIVIPKIYQHVNRFRNSVASVRLNDKCGFINSLGETVIPFIYDYAGYFDIETGIANVELDGYYGFIDINNQIQIPYKFTRAHPFRQGLASVSINDQWGFINSKGEVVIDLKYHYVFSFEKDFACVKLENNVYCYISKEGIEYWED